MDRDRLREAARGWDEVADAYVDALQDELDRKPFDREMLARFMEMARPLDGFTADIGCGPGHISRHLHRGGLAVRGYDLSPRMIAEAWKLCPGCQFEVADMLDLEWEPGTLTGATLLYSLVNIVDEDVPVILGHIADAMVGGAPMLIATHAGEGLIETRELLGRPVAMTAKLHTLERLVGHVEAAGFEVVEARIRDPYEEEYQSERAYVLARF